MSLLPKRTVKDPSTPEERRVTNRNVANIYKGLEYGSYALGGLGLAKLGVNSLLKGYKRAVKLGQILTDRKSIKLYRGVPLGKVPLKDAKEKLKYDKKDYGNWFTTDKEKAQRYARVNLPDDQRFYGGANKNFVGKLYTTKVSPTELRKIKQTSALHGPFNRKVDRDMGLTTFIENNRGSMKLTSKSFTGTVPKEIRRTATLLQGGK